MMARHKVFLAEFERAAEIAGSETLLARAIGWSQTAVNKAKRRRNCSGEMALAIHHFTRGEVSASSLRPDLWDRPEHVPPPPPEAGNTNHIQRPDINGPEPEPAPSEVA